MREVQQISPQAFGSAGLPRVPGTSPAASRSGLRANSLTFGVSALLVLGLTAALIRSEYQEALATWRVRLTSVAEERSQRLSDWLNERRADGQIFANSLSVRIALQADHSRRVAKNLSHILDQMAGVYSYTGIYVLDRQMRLVAKSGSSTELSPALVDLCRRAARRNTPRIDLLGDTPAQALISFITPVLPDAEKPTAGLPRDEALGVTLLVANPRQSLFPIMAQESVPTRSGETILMRHKGSEVVFFSPLRFRPQGSPDLRFPYPAAPLPARNAVEGHETFLETADYRGMPTLAVTRHIGLADWGMVRKIDRAEAFEEFRKTAWAQGFTAVLLLIALGGALASYRHYTLTGVLRAEGERFRTLLESVPEAIYIVEPSTLRIVGRNRKAKELDGYSDEDLVHMSAADLHPAEESGLHTESLRTASQPAPPSPPHLLHHCTKDGRLVPVEESYAVVNAGGEKLILSVVWDISMRVRAERALAESNEQNRRLADLLEKSSQPFAVGYPDGGMGQLNKAFERLTGYSRQELQSMDWSLALTPPEWREIESAKIQELLGTGRPVRYEKEYLRKDGSRVPIELLVHLQRDKEGKSEFFYAFVNDLTERKRAEASLRESEEQFRTLANAIPQLCWTANADGWITWYNERWYQYTGTTPQDMEGWGWQSVHDPEILPKVLERWKASISTGEPFDMVFPLRGADGVFRPFLTRVMPVRDQQGMLVRWFGTNTDISDQKRVEEALRQTEVSLAQAQRIAHMGNWEWDIAADRAWWSEEMYRIFGLDSQGDNLTLERSLAFMHPDDRGAVQAAVKRALEGREPYEMEYRIVRQDGSQRYVSAQGEVSFDAERRPLRMVGIVHDITQRKQAEEEIHRLNEELEQRVVERTAQLAAANQELEAFSYSVSHDLRAPLRHVDGFSKILSEEFQSLLPPDAQEYIAIIRDSVRQMGMLIDDLLRLARVGRAELRFQATNLGELAQEIVDDLNRANPSRRIEWRIQPLPPVECDRSLMRQVLANLLLNAVKFTRPRELAVIEVGACNHHNRPVFFVHDNGTGFDMKYADKLFGVFQRLHRAEDFEGTGVGLAIVQRIIHKHGGRVWAEAQLDRGATFYFMLQSNIEITGESHVQSGGVS
jgi:PAS domain S-box-containing protein